MKREIVLHALATLVLLLMFGAAFVIVMLARDPLWLIDLVS